MYVNKTRVNNEGFGFTTTNYGCSATCPSSTNTDTYTCCSTSSCNTVTGSLSCNTGGFGSNITLFNGCVVCAVSFIKKINLLEY